MTTVTAAHHDQYIKQIYSYQIPWPIQTHNYDAIPQRISVDWFLYTPCFKTFWVLMYLQWVAYWSHSTTTFVGIGKSFTLKGDHNYKYCIITSQFMFVQAILKWVYSLSQWNVAEIHKLRLQITHMPKISLTKNLGYNNAEFGFCTSNNW